MKVITGKVRLSYAHIAEPYAHNEGDKEKYSCSVIVSKDDEETIKKIEEAVESVIKNEGSSKWGNKRPAKLKTPLRDGDEEKPDSEEYANSYFFNCSTMRQPQCVDADRMPIDASEIYSGCNARISVNFYPYSVSGNKGVAAGLGNIQLLPGGANLGGGGSTAAEDFGKPASDFDDESDDMMG